MRRFYPSKWVEQFAKRPWIEHRSRAFASGLLRKAFLFHCRDSSSACSRRSCTVGGDAPPSLISIAATTSWRSKNVRKIDNHWSWNPATLVRTRTVEPAGLPGSIKTSRFPEATTPTWAWRESDCCPAGNSKCNLSNDFSPALSNIAFDKINKNHAHQPIRTASRPCSQLTQRTIQC